MAFNYDVNQFKRFFYILVSSWTLRSTFLTLLNWTTSWWLCKNSFFLFNSIINYFRHQIFRPLDCFEPIYWLMVKRLDCTWYRFANHFEAVDFSQTVNLLINSKEFFFLCMSICRLRLMLDVQHPALELFPCITKSLYKLWNFAGILGTCVFYAILPKLTSNCFEENINIGIYQVLLPIVT